MSLASRSTRGASLLVAGQLVTKMFTFLLNQLLIRHVSPLVFGTAAYFEVWLSTALFFSREAVRLSLQRVGGLPQSQRQHVVNFGYLALCVGVPLSFVLAAWQLRAPMLRTIAALPHARWVVALFWGLFFLELLAEPLYGLNQLELGLARRTKIESAATVARCAVTFAAARAAGAERAMLAFALGQLCYSGVVFVAYHCGSRPRVLLALPRVGRARFDPPTLALWRTVLVQTAFKQVLTEGDRLMMNYICSVEDQGVYLVVTNYGSLVARLLLQPVEELLRLYLTRLFAAADSAATATAKRVMQHVCLAYVVLAAIIALGGYPSASYLLRVVLGARSAEWLRATNLFAVFPQYVLYIPLLAFNGVLEAFFSSVATPREIAAHSRFMFALTLAYLATMYFLVAHCQRGLLGLIVANAINMALRILYCTVFVLRFFGDVSVGAILSAAAVPVLVALAVGAFEYFAIGYVASFGQLVRSAACCGFYVATMAVYERRLVAEAIRSFKSKQE